MKRLLLTLLLVLGPSGWADGKPTETNATVAEAAAVSAASQAERKARLLAELKALDTQKDEELEPWRHVLDAYVHYALLQKDLDDTSRKIQQLAGEQNLSKKTEAAIASLRSSEKAMTKKLRTIDAEALKAVTFYLSPTSSELSINDRMYRTFEARAQALEKLKQRLQQRRDLLNSLLQLDPENRTYEQQLLQTRRELDVITRIQERLHALSDMRLTKVNDLRRQLSEVEGLLGKDNIWQKSYNTYLTYMEVKHELEKIDGEIKKLEHRKPTTATAERIDSLMARQRILTDQLALLQSHGTSPFAELLKPAEIEEMPKITNPIDIFSGFSFNKKIGQQLKDYRERGEELKKYLDLLLKKRKLLERLATMDTSENYLALIDELDQKIEKYETAYSTVQDTANVYAKRIEEIELKINKAIEEQLYKLANIGGIILFLLIFFFIMKQIAKKYISDNERFYMANKVITFANITLILLVLLFNYIENVSYVVTVLGFASAGIAIAMKDWFMSMLGWLVIVFGGSIHVGDRIRVDKDGMKYVGDVLDISLLRITVLEDITLTSYMHNRRAGRVIFIPNNYIFTHMIANYTHVSLKTVWDGIDITITFDSNHKKAAHIAKEITRKYAKGYTDITRNQLNKLRSRYNLKNINVDPRIYTFIEENGVRISAWYLTNAYATLTLRSTISMEIIDAFGTEDDITIAYPTQRLRQKKEPLPQPHRGEEGEPV